MNYVEADTIKLFAEAAEAADDSVWNIFAEAASRVFDRAAHVADDFFAPSDNVETEKSFPVNSAYLKLPPYLAGTITSVKFNDVALDTYEEKDGYLILNDWNLFPSINYSGNNIVKATAIFGFESIPADIKLAVIEQALFVFRRKDVSFTEMSGVSSQTVNSPLSPTCEFIAEKYRGIYGGINYFA